MINPFSKELFTEEEVENEKIDWMSHDGYIFKASNLRMRGGLDIYQAHGREEDLITAIMDFTLFWCKEIHSRLNGFSGVDTFKKTVHYNDGRVVEFS